MRELLAIFFCLAAALPLSAQTNPAPVRLAIVSASPGAGELADRLTAELSGDARIHLLERTEVERIYREQGLSAANRDDLKLGRMLGADGLLLLTMTGKGTNQVLDTRLVAVKPGVVVTAEKFAGLGTTVDWPASYAKRLQTFLPKLTVMANDAVPVSIVNLRSAISSADAVETDSELQTLIIQRLSREPQLFVLERQKLQQLGEEKVLSADESAFWNGAWLLEGVADQNGFSKDTITLSARLTPSKGGAPVLLEAAGGRTNFAEVINVLATKVVTALKVTPTVKEWNAGDEAVKYFAEAQWALRWGAFKEAQAAADSAWALGKKDLECALVRGRAYLMELQSESVRFQNGESTLSAGYNADGKPLGPTPSDQSVQAEIRRLASEYPLMIGFSTTEANHAKSIQYAFADKWPTRESISHALHILELYQAFNRESADGIPKVLWRGPGWSDWHNSDWYQLGLDDLAAASGVLQAFCLVPDSQNNLTDDLADLRARTRSVAGLLFQSPSVYNGYFVGSRVANHDELSQTMVEKPNIFSSMVSWGCFWQERPEDTVALYRKLMGSPVFCYIHPAFWNRDIPHPYLAAWNEEDRKRIPAAWNSFLGELDTSTNLLWRLEAHALALTVINDDSKLGAAFTNFFGEIFTNRSELIANPVEVIYENWNGDTLAKHQNGGSVYSKAREQLSLTYYSTYRPQLEAMNSEYWDKTVPAGKTSFVFEDQKKFLRENRPYDSRTFDDMFREKSYSQEQAQEILALIIAYKSNLLAGAESTDKMEKFRRQSAVHSVEFFLQRDVERMAHPESAKPPVQPAVAAAAAPVLLQRPAHPLKPETATAALSTNIIPAEKYLEIPLDEFSLGELMDVRITSHHWLEGKLVLDLRCAGQVVTLNERGYLQSARGVALTGIAILDPATEHWQVIPCPPMDESAPHYYFYHHTTLCHGELFTGQGGKIRKYDAAKKTWQELVLPDIGNCELFTVNDRLYAANHDLIVEILQTGGTHTLASNRRQPPVSALDADNLGTPTLFAGPGGSLRVATANKIWSSNGTNWDEVCAAPKAAAVPVISAEGVLFSGNGWNSPAGIWRLPVSSEKMEHALGPIQSENRMPPGSPVPTRTRPFWQTPPGVMAGREPAASRGSQLWLLADHSKSEDIVNEQEHLIIGKKILPQDGYHAELYCFSEGHPEPQKIFMKFAAADSRVPLDGGSRQNASSFPGHPISWLCVGSGNLFVGRESSDAVGAYQTQVGIWMIPTAPLDAEIARQKKIQDEQVTQDVAAAKQSSQLLLLKYDQNHDGIIQGDEKEAALADENFITSQLDQIDTNKNGWLDPEALKYFDANKNAILDANEQTGIGIAQRLLARRLLRKFDADGNGLLDHREFTACVQSSFGELSRMGMVNSFPDQNHDNWIDVDELETLYQAETLRSLQTHRGPGMFPPGLMQPGMISNANSSQRFKILVENIWNNHDGNPGRPPHNGFTPPAIRPPGQPQ